MKLHEDIKRIKEVMGVINEQKISLPYIISNSFQSNNADDAHNFKQLENEVDGVLPILYNQGINPKMTDIKISITKNGNNYNTSYRLIIDRSSDGKAWMGFTYRGSIGTNYQKRADAQITGTGDVNGRSIWDKLRNIGAVDFEYINGSPVVDNNIQLKQYFIQFTKPKKYPPHNSGQQTQNNLTKTITGNDITSFINNIKNETLNASIDPKQINLILDTKSNKYSLTYKVGSTKILKLVLAINLVNDKINGVFPSRDNILNKNPGSYIIRQGTFENDKRDYALIALSL